MSGLSQSIAVLERRLADPELSPVHHEPLETMLEHHKQALAERQTNAQLWANLRLAHGLKDTDQIARSQQELADYMATRLSKRTGKTYPPGMSLKAVTEEYRTASGGERLDRQSGSLTNVTQPAIGP